MAALKETTSATGHTYKYVTAMNESRHVMGDLGNVIGGRQHTYERIVAKDKTWVVSGNVGSDAAAIFFYEFRIIIRARPRVEARIDSGRDTAFASEERVAHARERRGKIRGRRIRA